MCYESVVTLLRRPKGVARRMPRASWVNHGVLPQKRFNVLWGSLAFVHFCQWAASWLRRKKRATGVGFGLTDIVVVVGITHVIVHCNAANENNPTSTVVDTRRVDDSGDIQASLSPMSQGPRCRSTMRQPVVIDV